MAAVMGCGVATLSPKTPPLPGESSDQEPSKEALSGRSASRRRITYAQPRAKPSPTRIEPGRMRRKSVAIERNVVPYENVPACVRISNFPNQNLDTFIIILPYIS